MNRKGIYLGVNKSHTLCPVIYSFPTKVLSNSENIVMIGKSGIGRSFYYTIPFSGEEYKRLGETV